MKNYALRVDDEIYKSLTRMAHDEGMSVNKLINVLLSSAIQRRSVPSLLADGLVLAIDRYVDYALTRFFDKEE